MRAKRELAFLRNLVVEVGEEIFNLGDDYSVSLKSAGGRADYLTSADLLSEKLVVSAIARNFPEDTILSEETFSDIEPLTDGFTWVLDPIDGTNNFKNSRNYSAISLALYSGSKPQLAAVYNFLTGDLYTAEAENGSFYNDEQLREVSAADLENWSVATDNSYNPKLSKRILRMLTKLKPAPWAMIKGSCALQICEVAVGSCDLYFHIDIKPWDFAGSILVAQETGCAVCDINGDPITLSSNSIVVGKPNAVEYFLTQIQK